MRRTTSYAIGGMLAGTVLLGVDGTVAAFHDTESVSVTAGAGRLALLDPAPDEQHRALTVGRAVTVLPVRPEVLGTGSALLRLRAEDTHHQDPCGTDLVLTIALPQPMTPVTKTLCDLAGDGVDLLVVDEGTASDVALAVSAAVAPGAGPRAGQWRGDLLVTLEQRPAQGFSDQQLVPVHVVVPNPQGRGGAADGAQPG